VLEQFVAARRQARAKLYLRIHYGSAPPDDPKRNAEIKKLINNESEMGSDEFAQEIQMMAVGYISSLVPRSLSDDE
jgi:hypothetical protein